MSFKLIYIQFQPCSDIFSQYSITNKKYIDQFKSLIFNGTIVIIPLMDLYPVGIFNIMQIIVETFNYIKLVIGRYSNRKGNTDKILIWIL